MNTDETNVATLAEDLHSRINLHSSAPAIRNEIEKTLETLLTSEAQKREEAVREAVKPYQDGIRQMARDLREAGFEKTADIVERDLAVLDKTLTNPTTPPPNQADYKE